MIVPEVEDLEVRHEDEAGAKDEASDHGEEEFVDVLRMFSSSFWSSAESDRLEIIGKVNVETQVEDVEAAKGDDGDPDWQTEVAHHESVHVGLDTDVLGVLDQEATEKQVTNQSVEWEDPGRENFINTIWRMNKYFYLL